jgi:hypothetical protein
MAAVLELAKKAVVLEARVYKLETLIATLWPAIQHGSDEHKKWLRQAIENHFKGLPVPPAHG